MSTKTKIVVLHMKEVIYTAVFAILAIVLSILLFVMFGPGHEDKAAKTAPRYNPGIYTSSIELNSNTFDVEVTVDAERIQSVSLHNLSETTAAMFPLVEPALESIASQLYITQSLEEIEYSSDQKYTSVMLMNSIEKALEKAELK